LISLSLPCHFLSLYNFTKEGKNATKLPLLVLGLSDLTGCGLFTTVGLLVLWIPTSIDVPPLPTNLLTLIAIYAT
jgi:hypothetical protein